MATAEELALQAAIEAEAAAEAEVLAAEAAVLEAEEEAARVAEEARLVEEARLRDEANALELADRGFDENIHEVLDVTNPTKGFKAKYVEPAPKVIRIITTGAMQTRFSVLEEASIAEGADPVAKVLLSRLFNAKNVNLDLAELTEGVGYIVNYLDSVGVIYLNTDPSVRLGELLMDGTEDEAY